MSNSLLETYQKQTNRRLDGLEKNIELILKILNKFVDDMEPEMDSLKNAMTLNKEKQQNIHEEIQKDLKQVQFSVEDKLDDVQKVLDNKEMIIVKQDKLAGIKKLLKIN